MKYFDSGLREHLAKDYLTVGKIMSNCHVSIKSFIILTKLSKNNIVNIMTVLLFPIWIFIKRFHCLKCLFIVDHL